MPLSEDDRRHARAALERGWLTIDDVASCKEAAEKTGLAFLDVAKAKGLLTPERIREVRAPAPPVPPPKPRPARPMPPFYAALLALAGLVLIGSEVYFRIRAKREEDRSERDTAESRRRADEAARETNDRTRARFAEQDRDRAANWLRQARILLLHAEETLARNPKENLDASLKEATGYYCLYLDAVPGDADARFERAETHLYRGAMVDAQRDLEAACGAAPGKAAAFRAKFAELRRRFDR